MNILFAGTPPFAATALEALLNAGHKIPLTLTQPDRPAGRGLKPQFSAVKQLALLRDIPVAQPASLNDGKIIAQLAALNCDVMVVAAYGLILPVPVLRLPRLGCLNIHASLLPRWRGAAPIQRAILAGDSETGVTIMQMEAGLDTGDMLSRKKIPITITDTAKTLHDKLSKLGAQLIVETLREKPLAEAQDGTLATYAAKVTKTEAQLDWMLPAVTLDRAVRAFNPVPGAFTIWQNQPLKIWRAEPASAQDSMPGMVVQADASGIVVGTGRDVLRVMELQRAGSRRMDAATFLMGASLQSGTRFGI